MDNDKHNFAEDENKDSGNDRSDSKDNLCLICGGDHNVLLITLETGNLVIPKPFFYERMGKAKSDINNTTKIRKISTKVDMI